MAPYRWKTGNSFPRILRTMEPCLPDLQNYVVYKYIFSPFASLVAQWKRNFLKRKEKLYALTFVTQVALWYCSILIGNLAYSAIISLPLFPLFWKDAMFCGFFVTLFLRKCFLISPTHVHSTYTVFPNVSKLLIWSQPLISCAQYMYLFESNLLSNAVNTSEEKSSEFQACRAYLRALCMTWLHLCLYAWSWFVSILSTVMKLGVHCNFINRYILPTSHFFFIFILNRLHWALWRMAK